MAKNQDLGNGDLCTVNPEHGRQFVLATGSQWCAHSDHTPGKHGARDMTKFVPKDGESALDKDPTPISAAKSAKGKEKATEKPRRATAATTQTATEGPECLCGCKERTKGGRFRPGHDARYHAAQKKAADEAAAK